MPDLILTGASRGIGRALALAVAKGPKPDRLVLVSRDRRCLEGLAADIQALGGRALVVPGDLSFRAAAQDLGRRLAAVVRPGATLVHNAGVWPSKRTFTADGLETAFAVNHLAPLVMQQVLLDAGLLRRVMVMSAGLLEKGRFDPARTPTGEDFSGVRTYCTTKLCFALEMQNVAAAHPELDVVVVHPGVVRTQLGARRGPVGWLLALVKRGWESPESCAQRLARILARERWSPPGEAKWLVEEQEQAWPPVTRDEATRAALHEVTQHLLPRSGGSWQEA
jgi:NAD(P)-dependent dehydrogenase (short-subunit alcohol dehydrogenase family)